MKYEDIKIGDKVKVVKPQRGNHIVVGSYGVVIDKNKKGSPVDRKETTEFTIQIRYDCIPNVFDTPENREETLFNGCFWTIPERLELIKKEWRNII